MAQSHARRGFSFYPTHRVLCVFHGKLQMDFVHIFLDNSTGSDPTLRDMGKIYRNRP